MVRSFLIFALALPVAPVMADMLHAAGNVTADGDCLHKINSGSSASSDYMLAHDVVPMDHEKCENTRCPDGKCQCRNSCMHSTASSIISMFSGSFPLFLIDDGSKLFSSLENNHAANKSYLPELHPPIC